MAHEGIHEFQVNGKQLIFLFMSTIVVAVVIFLCGVLVGRGLKPPALAAATAAIGDGQTDPTAEAVAPPPAAIEGAPAAANETLTYAARLDDTAPPPETLREGDPDDEAPARTPAAPRKTETTRETRTAGPAARINAPAPESGSGREAAARTSPAATAPKPPPPAAPPAAAEPRGNGFVVQVASVNRRAEADVIARRLSAKGYPTFVTTFGSGSQAKFRVRVGKYADRREAETIAGRLKKEEEFNTWITR